MVLSENSMFEYPDGRKERDDGIPASADLSDKDEVRLAKMHLIDMFGKGDALDLLLEDLLQDTAAEMIIPTGIFEHSDEPDLLDELDKKELAEFAAEHFFFDYDENEDAEHGESDE